MYRQPVDSSNIRSVGYDDTIQTMEIEFHHGGIYHYPGIPPHIHQALMHAGSKGAYFNQNIKSRYSFVRVN